MYIIEIERTGPDNHNVTVRIIKAGFIRVRTDGAQDEIWPEILAEANYDGDPPGIHLLDNAAFLRLL